jgi:hypothetical protein
MNGAVRATQKAKKQSKDDPSQPTCQQAIERSQSNDIPTEFFKWREMAADRN